ncbi:sensor domain-containing diguanylate cyclase [Yersinia kristensenii]|uniref:sensor domain-containing diguanylate cyclase n=1 Tax=Yersinia kristensenii TaxID=28152 RepID=UPI0005EA24BD|nr:sensor domain-containing diguanylate cyclase [Yersinia kristensenii]MDA5474056.1 diguanylate cyclase [Yersinia kristensenii]MDA5476762.1 diguanylate cyclase [Yersinia kristensenii]MDA5505267.1 diguanylate cyclase [Yersinia kristensenii]MDA5522344.1 diguanylate cyclase [Yersinia kristensenii]MDR4898742.1 diguanylate cyclase [Yersinia kristensenii]
MSILSFYHNCLGSLAKKVFGKHPGEPVKRKNGKSELSNLQLDVLLNAEKQVAIITTDLDNCVTIYNVGAERMFGYSKDEVIGKPISDILHIPENGEAQVRLDYLLLNRREASEWCYQRKDGERFWGALSVHEITSESGNIVGYISVIADVSERKSLLIELEKSQKMMDKLTKNLPAMIYAYYLNSDGESHFSYCSEGIRQIFDLAPADVLHVPQEKNPLFSRIHTDDMEMLKQAVITSQQNLSVWSCDFRVVLPGKGTHWLHGESFPTRQDDGSVIWYGSFFDITELKQSESILKALSQTDVLTGVANRRHFDDLYQNLWQKNHIEGGSLSVLMIDFDNFKSFNDLYGHAMGDVCLKSIVETLAKSIRGGSDILARYGGEEFIVLLAPSTLADATAVAERMRHSIEELDIPHGMSPHGCVTISVGVASVSEPGEHLSAKDLSDAADKALYRAKTAGKNQVKAVELN